jgi:uncharacterized RDD family membrane protein YckC
MSPKSAQHETVEFIGIVYRFGALLADGLIIIGLNALLLFALFGENAFADENARELAPVLTAVLSIMYLLGWWIFAGTSPGKWFCSARIVDFKTGQRAHAGRLVLRLLACLLSAAPLLLGFLMAARNPYKRAWHDRIARTAVIGDRSLRAPTTEEQDDAHYCVHPAPWVV